MAKPKTVQGIRQSDIDEFMKYAGKLDALMKKVRAYHPEAGVYATRKLCS